MTQSFYNSPIDTLRDVTYYLFHALRAKARAEILAAAQSIGCTSSPEWII